MPFYIQPIREFLVRPALPEELSRMPEVAYNILWSWEPIVRALFRRLDPMLWKESGYNPVVMLGRVSQTTLAKAASDPRYLALYTHACERYDSHIKGVLPPDGKLIAYFSAEYGLTECMPIYSGGLGVLSGDHLKSSSDLNLPLVAIGLLYQQGYFRQYLNPDGWQQERYPINDFYTLPVLPVRDAAGNDVKISVDLPTGPVYAQIWQMRVGRIRLFLLDTNIPDNPLPQDRGITDQLYGGDTDKRIRQEIILGVGGVRALKALNLDPTVFHMNEGHSAFLAVERIRVLMAERDLTFDDALEASRCNNVFTTHTPVPAGIDLFDPGQIFYYFNDYCRTAGFDFPRLLSLGRWNPDAPEERFSMAVLALKTSTYRNAVSRLHRNVSQEMWHGLWPDLPTWEVPITSITNGVHLPSWINGDLSDLYDQYLQPDWREQCNNPATWDRIHEIPDEELLEAHRRRKRRLIAFLRERQVQASARRKAPTAELRRAGEVLDPNALTIGFARRFATYKRATLILRDVDRLKRLLCSKERPVQIVIAGKAHPKDHPGKSLIREIVQLSRDPDLWKHIVMVEDYDMKVARELVQGVDLWLNNPRRGEEACGTSGMKAGINGVLNLSILDGWFDEAYEISGGWAIGDRESYSEDQDAIHASSIYYLLENEIVPAFYERRDQGVPREWIRRVKQSLMGLSPQYNCRRMVGEYTDQLYTPAHLAYAEVRGDRFRLARERTLWNQKIREVWDRVDFVDTGATPPKPVTSGCPVEVRAAVEMAGLDPGEVRVEAVVGRVGSNGDLEETEVLVLPHVKREGSVSIFATDLVPEHTGRLGYALRISPNHYEDPLTRPCPAILKWAR
ncbi:MAG: alpha-glucan family phosphorylase [Bryobacteraceae bacterium]